MGKQGGSLAAEMTVKSPFFTSLDQQSQHSVVNYLFAKLPVCCRIILTPSEFLSHIHAYGLGVSSPDSRAVFMTSFTCRSAAKTAACGHLHLWCLGKGGKQRSCPAEAARDGSKLAGIHNSFARICFLDFHDAACSYFKTEASSARQAPCCWGCEAFRCI